MIIGSLEYLLHVVILESTHHAEKELSLWELSGELFLRREVLAEYRIQHCIIIEVLHRDFFVVGNLHMNDLIALEMLFFVTK